MKRSNINMLVVENIKSLMEEKGLDAAKLARRANLNPTGVYDILSGKSKSPKVETLEKITDALMVPLTSVFRNLEEDRLGLELNFVLSQLSQEDRQKLLKTGRAWLPDQEDA